MRSKQACRPVLMFVTESDVAAERVFAVLPQPVGQAVVCVVVVVAASAGTAATLKVAAMSATVVAHAVLLRPISSPGRVVCLILGETFWRAKWLHGSGVRRAGLFGDSATRRCGGAATSAARRLAREPGPGPGRSTRRRLLLALDVCAPGGEVTRLLVVGGGIAGAGAALALHKAGFDVALYEAHPDSAEDIGAFLTPASNGCVPWRGSMPRPRSPSHFADGGTATGDLLVGADGLSSTVRRLIAPDARPRQPVNASSTAVPTPHPRPTPARAGPSP
jgi:hypothetical protein